MYQFVVIREVCQLNDKYTTVQSHEDQLGLIRLPRTFKFVLLEIISNKSTISYTNTVSKTRVFFLTNQSVVFISIVRSLLLSLLGLDDKPLSNSIKPRNKY